MEKTCCFFGHRKIEITEELQNRLLAIIENLIISENVTTFLFGSRNMRTPYCPRRCIRPAERLTQNVISL